MLLKRRIIIKKILVCGGTGFIGRNAIEFFSKSQEYKVFATYHNSKPFDDKNVEWIYADLRNASEVSELINNFDILIQGAATTSGVKDSFDRPDYHVTDNALMNSIIFREANLKKVGHVIFFSCTTMLKSSSNSQTEDSFDANSELYSRYFGVGWTKVYLEKMCEFFSRQGNTKFTVIRHSNVYGPWDKYGLENSHVFGATITKVLSAKGSVKIWGTGQEKRDLLYIDDLIKLVELAINKQSPPFRIFNAGGGVDISIKDLTQLIAQMANKTVSLEFELDKPSVDFSILLDNSRAESELGWAPEVSLNEGILRSIKFWNENIEVI